MEEQIKKTWRLISQNGVAPVVSTYYYRGYRIVYSYYYNRGIHTFVPIILTTPRGKRFEFFSFEELNEFLKKRNLPPF